MKFTKKILLLVSCLAFLAIRSNIAFAAAGQLKNFSFSTAGMSRFEFREFTAMQEEQGLHLHIDVWVEKDGEDYQVQIDKIVHEPQLLPDLEKVISELNLAEWNGFNRNNKGALDGDGFGFLAVYEDGSEIRARGNVAHPKNYQQARTAIMDIFKPYVEKYNEQHTGAKYS